MKIKNVFSVILFFAAALTSQKAKAQFILVDNFANAVQGNLALQTSDGPSNAVWHALTSASVVTVTNSPTPGIGQPGSGTPLTTNAACTTDINDGAADIALPVPISTSSTASTIFMQFDMGPDQTQNNVNWAVVNTPGSDAGGANDKIELNANQSTGGNRLGVTIRDGGYFGWLSSDGINAFVPQNSTAYNMWFVINNSAQNFIIYMQDASTNGTDLPTLTRMWVSTTGAAGSLTSQTYTTNAIAYRNTTASSLLYFVFGSGGSSGYPQTQYLYSLYEDPNSMDLTNPVTGVAPLQLSPPVITSEPQSVQVYAGATAAFTIAATGGGLNYQWKTNGVAVGNGGNISGATSSTLTISNVSAANAGSYSCTVNNANTGAYQSTNSIVVSLTIVSPDGAFETALAATGPQHFYAFDDTGSPSSGTEVAIDYTGGDNGIYGIYSENGVNGPRPVEDGLPGFSEGNYAVEFFGYDEPSHVMVNSPWNLNTNTVTIAAWINPNGPQDPSEGIVFNRGGGNDAEGLNMSATYNSTLGYTWNNDAGTTSWDSGLQPPSGQWSFVALVVTPTNATIHMMNTNGIFSTTHVFPHVPAAFGGTTMIGDDSGDSSGARTFIGSIDEVAVFNQALTRSQLQSFFTNASGVAAYPPYNSVALATTGTIYPSQTAQFSSIVGGSGPLSYTWQLNGANLTDGVNGVGLISGSATPSLTISNLASGTAGQTYYLTLVSSNSMGVYTSSVPAVLTVSTTGSAQTIHTLGMEASGTDWNTATNWDDNLPASASAIEYPGSTYQIVPGTLERSPVSTNASFPGSALQVLGNGILLDGNLATFPTNTTTGELRLRQSGTTSVTNVGGTVYANGGTINFPDLQLMGGQVDNAGNKVTLTGQMDVLSNSAVYVDSGANGSIRSIQVNSFLTGTGTLTYGYLSTATANNNLIIAGTTNTFSGQWNIVGGTLLGTALNCLGTNTITIGTNSALETTYNLYHPAGNLFLNGRMFLYTSNTFNSVVVGNVSLTNGTYTSAQLNSLFPANFPTNWPVQIGSSTGTNTGVGYLTVLTTLLPAVTQQPTNLSLWPGQTAQFAATVFGANSYQWWFTNSSMVGSQLTDGGTISGSHSNVLTIASVAAGNAGTYTLVVANTAGSTNSIPVTLTISGTNPGQTITMLAVETAGQDWDTGTNWSDGLKASVSIYAEPNSSYTVLSGAVLRTPAGVSSAAFPGNPLIIANGGELLLEHSGAGSIAFPDLQLNGLMDNGADGLATLTGQMDVTNNATIYTDTNAPAGLVVNFDVPGGVGGINYAGLGAYPDLASHTNWNPIAQTAGRGTTTAPATNSDGIATSPITFTLNSGGYGEGGEYGRYDPYDNSAGSPSNTPVALEDNYFSLNEIYSPGFQQTFITNSLNNVPAGTYNLYLYGNDGGHTVGGFNDLGYQNDWGTTFTVATDTYTNTLSTSNSAASYTPSGGAFVQSADYVIFSNVVVGVGGTITFTFTANTNTYSPDYAGPNGYAAFNGLQLATVVATAAGPRPFAINSFLTGNGTVTYNAGDTSYASDLDIAGTSNTFSGQWNVVQGALLGGAAGSLGTNTITVGADGALETLYNINNTNAGLVLNGKMFLHTADTFKTLIINGVTNYAGTYSFSELTNDYPANFPPIWPVQTGSTVSAISGQITVLSPPGSGGSSTNTTLVIQQSGSSLILSWTNNAGTTLQTTTNLASGSWTPVVGATSPYTNNILTNGPVRFYRVHP